MNLLENYSVRLLEGIKITLEEENKLKNYERNTVILITEGKIPQRGI